jgi:hypothetical protein
LQPSTWMSSIEYFLKHRSDPDICILVTDNMELYMFLC